MNTAFSKQTNDTQVAHSPEVAVKQVDVSAPSEAQIKTTERKSSSGIAKQRSKVGFAIVLSQIPKHADLKIVKGAIRARIGKFKCVRCEMYRHGCCKIWVRKPETRTKILNNDIFIFGVQIESTLEEDGVTTSVEQDSKDQTSEWAVYLGNISRSCSVKKLMGMVKQIVGDFTARNRVTINNGQSKIVFRFEKHQRTLLKNGFSGELSQVSISMTPPTSFPTSTTSVAASGSSSVISSRADNNNGNGSSSTYDSDASSGGVSSWGDLVRTARAFPDPQEQVSSHFDHEVQNFHDFQDPTMIQAEAAAELLYNSKHNSIIDRRASGNLSSSFLMLENEKLRMEIELLRMQRLFEATPFSGGRADSSPAPYQDRYIVHHHYDNPAAYGSVEARARMLDARPHVVHYEPRRSYRNIR